MPFAFRNLFHSSYVYCKSVVFVSPYLILKRDEVSRSGIKTEKICEKLLTNLISAFT